MIKIQNIKCFDGRRAEEKNLIKPQEAPRSIYKRRYKRQSTKDLLHPYKSFWECQNCKALILMVLSLRPLLRIDYVVVNLENEKTQHENALWGPTLYLVLLVFDIKEEEIYSKITHNNTEIHMSEVIHCNIVRNFCNLLYILTLSSCQNCGTSTRWITMYLLKTRFYKPAWRDSWEIYC